MYPDSRRPTCRRRLAAPALLLVLAACAPRAPGGVSPAPTSGAEVRQEHLPPVPRVEGALAPRIVYPPPNAEIAVRDSNFIFGSLGNGRATLTINGAPVPVAPNGAWLAYLPVPPASAPRYELVAVLGRDTARLSHAVRVPPPPRVLSLEGPLAVDAGSVTPGANTAARADERLRVALRAPANARVSVETPGGLRRALVAEGNMVATDLPAAALREGATLVAVRGSDTVRVAVRPVEILDASTPSLVRLGDLAPADTDRFVPVRPVPAGTYKWLLLPGTVLEATGRMGSSVRVRLHEDLDAWVDSTELRAVPAGTALPRRTVGSIRLSPAREWVDVVIPVGTRPAYHVEETERGMHLLLYGTRISPDLIRYLENDSLVRVINWMPERSDLARLSLELTQRPFGYLVLWDEARASLVLRLRRQPVTNPRRPLEGITIAVDAGHPPGGAVGPTGLTEPVATLPVARRVQELLEQRGARVVMTRTTDEAVALGLRSVIARRANAHALVSIHYNAFGDGVNPFTNNGTSTLFFHPQSEPLSRAVQSGMIRTMGLRDLGIHYQNIAIGRTTWMPSFIAEGAFMMIPEQEAAMRNPTFQDQYARGVVDGVEAYFRSLAP